MDGSHMAHVQVDPALSRPGTMPVKAVSTLSPWGIPVNRPRATTTTANAAANATPPSQRAVPETDNVGSIRRVMHAPSPSRGQRRQPELRVDRPLAECGQARGW